MAKRTSTKNAIKKFLKTTTLHGFKYLNSEYFGDRLCWVLCCCASACCAGLLCGVLWARFLKVPALLTLHDHAPALTRPPTLAVCPAVETIAERFLPKLPRSGKRSVEFPPTKWSDDLVNVAGRRWMRAASNRSLWKQWGRPMFSSGLPLADLDGLYLQRLGLMVESVSQDKTSNETLIKELPNILARALEKKPCAKIDLDTFDQLLSENNVTLYSMMQEHMPPCDVVVKKCRWQTLNTPCEHLFEKEATVGKMCCVMKSNEKLISGHKANLLGSLEVGQSIELALQCPSGSTHYGCEFFTQYDGELWVNPGWLIPGNYYIAQLRFISIPETTVTEKLVEESCVSESGYSQTDCLFQCAEKLCSCANPIREVSDNATNHMPCPIARLTCLRTGSLLHNSSCNCLPSCKKITTYMTLETSPMNFIQYTIDPIYAGLNVSSSIVMHFRVNSHLSRTFILNPTETWLTLLSSLGGVFNMFLGVGLFSALELLTLIFVKLPIAMQRSSEVTHPPLTPH